MEEGAFDNENDARSYILTNPIELELYYHKGYGLYGVESDAVEYADIYNPYDGTKMEEWVNHPISSITFINILYLESMSVICIILMMLNKHKDY